MVKHQQHALWLISRQHAAINVMPDGTYIEDLGSTNAKVINHVEIDVIVRCRQLEKALILQLRKLVFKQLRVLLMWDCIRQDIRIPIKK